MFCFESSLLENVNVEHMAGVVAAACGEDGELMVFGQ